MSAFDKVLFNEKGNQITLVKFFLPPARDPSYITG
jgi:hypothetical protein